MLKTWTGQGREISSYSDGGEIEIRVEGVAHFRLQTSQGMLSIEAREDIPEDTIRFWLLHQTLPFYLLLRGDTEMFHASAVEIGHGAAAFLAPSFVGKSTLANFLLERGHSLVTDEHLALSREKDFAALPSIPYHRPYRASEDLGRRVENFCTRPLPLRSIYLIEPAAAEADVAITEQRELEALNSLLRSQLYTTWNPAVPSLFPLVRKRFQDLSRVAREIRVCTLRVPRSLDRLPEVYERVVSHLEAHA